MPDTDIAKESSSLPQPLYFELPAGVPSERLDKVLVRLFPAYSRSRLQDWVDKGHVLVNGRQVQRKQTVGAGDTLLVYEQANPEDAAFVPEPVALEVVHEAPGWVVINKPSGLVVHPGAGNWRGTLLNGLLFRYPELAAVERAGIVHRLDKETSGLLVVARTESSRESLVQQLKDRTVTRQYLALVHGHLAGAAEIALPIGRDARVPVRMSTVNPVAPKQALTRYQVLRQGFVAPHEPVSELSCFLETGRTHQIRVHMRHLGHPLVADSLYGGKALAGAERQMLHASKLEFNDEAGVRQRFQSTVPVDFAQVIQAVQWLD